jgi:hypothetical protein
MNRIKILSAASIGTMALVAAFAFVSKPLATTTHRFDPPQSDPNKEREISTTSSLKLNTTDLVNTGYWASASLPSVTYASNGIYLRAITFDKELSSDGAGDGQLSLSEAITEVKNYFVANGTLPQDGDVIRVTGAGSPGFTDIVVKRSNDNTN